MKRKSLDQKINEVLKYYAISELTNKERSEYMGSAYLRSTLIKKEGALYLKAEPKSEFNESCSFDKVSQFNTFGDFIRLIHSGLTYDFDPSLK